MRPRRKLVILLCAVGFIAWIASREIHDYQSRRIEYPVIRQLGGKILGLPSPIPFTGSELSITFKNVSFTKTQVASLRVANSLARHNWLAVCFIDCDLTDHEFEELKTNLPDCHLQRRGSESSQKERRRC